MTDELILFLVLCMIYFSDCLLFVRNSTITFVLWSGKHWVHNFSGRLIRTVKGRVVLLNPFPPLGKVFCCRLIPLSISPKGVCSFNYQTLVHDEESEHEVVYVLFSEIEDIRTDNRDLFINDERFCRFTDERTAIKLRDFMDRLHNSIEEKREEIIIEFWKGQFDYDAMKKRFEQIKKKLSALRFLCNALFIYLFVIAPIFVLYFRLTRMLIPIAIGMLIIAIQVAISFFILHKKIYPDRAEERISNLIKMIMCPPVSIRACDLITANLLENYNPVAVGHLFLPPGEYKKFAERTLRNFKYPPVGYITGIPANEISIYQNQIFLRLTSDYIREVANIGEDLLYQPVPNDISVHSFCPRCLSQFTKEAGNCPDCPGLKLRTFDDKAFASNPSD